jgi:phosphohistidine phosphatase SixA
MRSDTLRLIVCRHGHARSTEHDPGLTSTGHSAARRLGEWVATRHPTLPLLLHTPTLRTRQTAEELALSLPAAALQSWPSAPESPDDWESFTAAVHARGWDQALLVAHHTTLLFLLRDLLSGAPRLRHPPPTTALVLEGRAGHRDWRLLDHRIGPLA